MVQLKAGFPVRSEPYSTRGVPTMTASEKNMRRSDHHHLDPEMWEYVQYSRPAIRARATLLLYTLLVSLPFVTLSASAAYLCGLRPHEITGVACYHAMLTSLFVFDTLRNAAHACFAEAWDEGLVTLREGIPVVEETYRHRRLARLSFAIGGQSLDEGAR